MMIDEIMIENGKKRNKRGENRRQKCMMNVLVAVCVIHAINFQPSEP